MVEMLTRADDGYDDEVRGFQTAYRHRPAVVVPARDAGDVRRAVVHAAERDLPVAVQATGHGLSVPADGGVLISTRRLTELHVDPVRRTARVGAGVRAGALVEAAAAHGLAPLNGSSPSVGVAGYTLGGGVGLLGRRFGFAADHVRRVEIVTADGLSRCLAPGDELFGAVLGSGGNFGVVTALEVDLVEVPAVFGGQLVFAAPLVPRVLEVWREWTESLREEVTSSVTLVPGPAGRIASVRVASLVHDAGLVAPLRAVGERLSDTVRTMPYAETSSIHRDPDEPHAYRATNHLLRDLAPEALEAVAGVGAVVDIRHLGGAMGRPGPAMVGHRAARYAVRVISGPDDRDVHERVARDLAPWTTGHNLAFLYGGADTASEAQTRAGYEPELYERLATLKARHDPRNLFRFNRNIAPARAAARVG
ncbi:FAD-binding oxidoreductase [Amycolatopsis thermophila]|uniref:FAD/FMN-containing dehydrogenase n=1 Tax=Amycolatopsis thermophila TaxID=206084 RepID=A0ABU0F4J4_9PSEU|nr:FAD-binding oxidoreductase [Amycolatopsis thermophila]MDQ0382086.1 FAD/FMN-containing dehydrogenase [Amycolatopsis thermophila]